MLRAIRRLITTITSAWRGGHPFVLSRCSSIRIRHPMQRTLILLKPDCVQRRLVGTIVQRFEQKGLRLVGLKFLQASRDLAEKHYAVHKGKPFYDSLLGFITAGPTVAMVWEGREAVAVARTLMGPTDGTKAPPATIRGDFALSVQNN